LVLSLLHRTKMARASGSSRTVTSLLAVEKSTFAPARQMPRASAASAMHGRASVQRSLLAGL